MQEFSRGKKWYKLLHFELIVDVGLEVLAKLSVTLRVPEALLADEVDEEHECEVLMARVFQVMQGHELLRPIVWSILINEKRIFAHLDCDLVRKTRLQLV